MTYAAGVVKKAKQPGPARTFVDGLRDGHLRRRPPGGGLRACALTARSVWFPLLLAAALAAALTFLTLPIVAIFVDSSPGQLLDSLGEPGALDALWLSLRTTAAAMAVILVVGTPAAYLLATRSFRGRAILVTLIELPAGAAARGGRDRAAGRGRAHGDSRRKRSTRRGSSSR